MCPADHHRVGDAIAKFVVQRFEHRSVASHVDDDNTGFLVSNRFGDLLIRDDRVVPTELAHSVDIPWRGDADEVQAVVL